MDYSPLEKVIIIYLFILSSNIDALDSHSAVITEQNNMLIFGGFIKEKGNYSNSIYEFDFSTSSWNTLFDSSQIDKQSKRPCGRCHSSMCIFNDKVYIFGGMNGNHKLNDFWCFDLKTKKWT
jgi:N-acetylneuraminic acid mutarotase